MFNAILSKRSNTILEKNNTHTILSIIFKGGVAEMVKRLLSTPMVPGSNPREKL